MNAPKILATLWAAGIRVRLKDGHLAVPAGRLSDEHRALVLNHRAELIQFLTEARETTAALVESAMRACDHWNDAPEAREQMRRECLETPPHLRADLLDHFNNAYRAKH